MAAALGGAVAMLLIGANDAEHAFYSANTVIDWNVLVSCSGMMIVVAVVKRTGLFDVPGDLGGQARPRPPVFGSW